MRPAALQASDERLFTVTSNAPPKATAQVEFSSHDGTAVAPGDYAKTSGKLSFGPGEKGKTVTVPVVGDAVHEPNEAFEMTLANPTGARVLRAKGPGAIKDDDTVPAAADLARNIAVPAAVVSPALPGTPGTAGPAQAPQTQVLQQANRQAEQQAAQQAQQQTQAQAQSQLKLSFNSASWPSGRDSFRRKEPETTAGTKTTEASWPRPPVGARRSKDPLLRLAAGPGRLRSGLEQGAGAPPADH